MTPGMTDSCRCQSGKGGQNTNLCRPEQGLLRGQPQGLQVPPWCCLTEGRLDAKVTHYPFLRVESVIWRQDEPGQAS